MKVLLAVFIATCCCVAARPAISDEANIQSASLDTDITNKQSPFIQPWFVNDERGVQRMLARPVGFIPIFMFPTASKRLSQQPESMKSGMARNLNLDSETQVPMANKETVSPMSENIENPASDLNQEAPLSPSSPGLMEGKEEIMPSKMEQPIPASLSQGSLLPSLSDSVRSQSIQTPSMNPMMDKKEPLPQLPVEHATLPVQKADALSRSKRQYPGYHRRRPYFYNNYYQGYPHGYDGHYDDWSGSSEWSDYDVGVDIEVFPRFF